ncbi:MULTISPECIES: hypothetical protein [Okeania]|nr:MULTISPECIES: hypothetical protein [Okeania]NET22983.1 hypothetical protein [Okeania sp. SIO1H5]NEP75595.1 hypothetical protein [Okeania sp. SIO2G5]NEP96722.1 hypothetical protein [Okeania sp. SIO2F5]NEQ94440.1 hypothetical protein [Okeania sp. SIO2G4]NES79294.1 hypothetical protein [Okeania sp. SIO1H4]
MLKKRCDPATTIVARERAPRDHKLASAIADCGFYEFKRQLIEPLSVSLDAVCAFGFRPQPEEVVEIQEREWGKSG